MENNAFCGPFVRPMNTSERIRLINDLCATGMNVVRIARFTDTVLRKVHEEVCLDLVDA